MNHFIFSRIVMSPSDEGAPAPETAAAAEKPAKAPKAPKAPKPEKVAKAKQPESNGITRPTPGTKTGDVWDIADSMSTLKGRPALREEVMASGTAAGINKGTIATQYARWTQFYGVTKEARQSVRSTEKAAAEPVAAPAEAAPAATE